MLMLMLQVKMYDTVMKHSPRLSGRITYSPYLNLVMAIKEVMTTGTLGDILEMHPVLANQDADGKPSRNHKRQHVHSALENWR
jgi:hypothetical protein